MAPVQQSVGSTSTWLVFNEEKFVQCRLIRALCQLQLLNGVEKDSNLVMIGDEVRICKDCVMGAF
jgi:hypothetical protein